MRDYLPARVLCEDHHVTGCSHPVYHIVSTLLCQQHFSLNWGALGKALLRLHECFSSTADPGRGAHVVAVFRKAEEAS